MFQIYSGFSQVEAISLHPIQRKAPGKVAGNLVGNGAASLSGLRDHISFHLLLNRENPRAGYGDLPPDGLWS
jgi:hypothetical protein